MINSSRSSRASSGVAIGIAACALAQPAVEAQVPSLQGPIREPIKPLILRHSFAPTIALANAEPPAAGRLVSMTFKISGLKGARAVHLYRFDPGCGVERQIHVGGLPITIDRPASPDRPGDYTTDETERTVFDRRNNFREPGTAGLPLDANGEARLSFTGVVGVGGGRSLNSQGAPPDASALQSRAAMDQFARGIGNGPLPFATACTPAAAFVFLGADGQWRTLDGDNALRDVTDPKLEQLVVRQGQPWVARPRRPQTVVSTSRLRDLLSPAMSTLAAGSTCSGMSTAFGQPSYPVGMREKDGDLTFSIRSGPAGTRCGVIFNKAALPPGVTVVNARFSVESVGSRCRLGNVNLPLDMFAFVSPVRGFSLDRVAGVVRAPELIQAGAVNPGATGWLDPFRFPETGAIQIQWQAHFAPMGATLGCEATAVNDHGVTLRFESAEFLVPDGVNLPLPP